MAQLEIRRGPHESLKVYAKSLETHRYRPVVPLLLRGLKGWPHQALGYKTPAATWAVAVSLVHSVQD